MYCMQGFTNYATCNWKKHVSILRAQYEYGYGCSMYVCRYRRSTLLYILSSQYGRSTGTVRTGKGTYVCYATESSTVTQQPPL